MIISQRDGKMPELKIDKRTLPKAPNLKHLRYSRILPLRCNDCRYRPKEEGGIIGGCSVYEKGSLCKIRSDIRKAVEKYSTRNPDELLPLLEEEFVANFEKLKFFETIEDMTGTLNPEVTKRINSLNYIARLILKLKLKKTTIEMSEKTTLSDETKQEIAKMFTVNHQEAQS